MHKQFAMALVGTTLAIPAMGRAADITGFNGFQVNTNTPNLTNGSYTIGVSGDQNTLTLTNSQNNLASSAFYTPSKVAVNGSFTASFTYTVPTGNADGTAFVLQNDSRGASALGGTGGATGVGTNNGVAAITPAIAYGFNSFDGNIASRGFQTITANSGNPYASNQRTGGSGSGVSFNSGRPLAVTLSYDAATGVTQQIIRDTVNGAIFSSSQTGQNIATQLGSTTATVGFSAGTGGLNSVQQVSNFKYSTGTSTALTYAPIAFRAGSFNNSVIVPAAASNADAVTLTGLITATMDRGAGFSAGNTGATFFEKGFTKTGAANNPPPATSGMPTSGSTFTSAADARHQFQMQNYGNPNTGNFDSVLLDNGRDNPADAAAQTMTFATPQAFNSLSFLVATGGNTSAFDLKVNYSDGTTVDLGNIVSPDWFGAGVVAYGNSGRFNISNNNLAGSFDNVSGTAGNAPFLFQSDVALPNSTTPIASVTLQFASTNNGELAVFAVSGGTLSTTTSVPEPTVFGAAAVAMGLFGKRRRRI